MVRIQFLLKVSALCAASTLGLSACLLTDMKEMHDSTVAMNEKMNHTNGGMDRTNLLVKLSYLDGRKKEAVDERNHSLKMMEESEEVAPKLKHASSFMRALEFQIFKPELENQAEREILFNEAVAEFFKLIQEYAGNRGNVSPKSTDGKMQNLYAISAALHSVNARQELEQAGTRYPVLSLLDLINQGLDTARALREGRGNARALPEYVKEVIRNEQDAVYILRIRQNFLTAYGFALSASPENGNELSLLQKGWFLIGHGRLGIDWTPVFDDRNTVQLEYFAAVLQYALATRDALKANGYDPKTDQSILRIFKNIDWSKVEQTTPTEGEGLNLLERREAVEGLRSTITRIISG